MVVGHLLLTVMFQNHRVVVFMLDGLSTLSFCGNEDVYFCVWMLM